MEPVTDAKQPNTDKIDWLVSAPFFVIHLIALTAFLVGFKWWYPLLALGSYYLRMFGITGGFHRYFAHRGYKTSRAFQFVLAWIGTMSAQKGGLWWAAHHRDHHKYSDQPEDIHSPTLRGLWWAHCGWVLSSTYDRTKSENIKDFMKYPELVWLNKWHFIPPTVYGVTLFLIGGWPVLIWGFFVSTVMLWHGTFTINSLSHVFGSVRYQTTDTSKNNWALALLTMGEGWHNNHHFYQSTANNGFFWWEVDATYYIIKALSWVGIVWDVRTPPKHIRDSYLEPASDHAPAEIRPAA
jgi:stearoyl-CoA desaturase (delta-9 desaturase)